MFDATDLRILDQLQRNSALTNHALAERVHVSPATCLRRVRRLVASGAIERQVAILSEAKIGVGITAIVELTLDEQHSARFADFETRADSEPSIQQCYRVASGPDFILVVHVGNMDAYHALAHRLFAASNNVRNVRTFFSVRRSKFTTEIALPDASA